MATSSKKASKTSHKGEFSLQTALDLLSTTIDNAEARANRNSIDNHNKEAKFNQDFKALQNTVINPAMLDIMKAFSLHGHGARVGTNNEVIKNIHIKLIENQDLCYYFQLKNKSGTFNMLIRGILAIQEVSLGIYISNEKPEINNFALSEVTKKLLESLIVKQVLKINSKINY